MKKPFPLAEREYIKELQLENQKNLQRLEILKNKSKEKAYYMNHQRLFNQPMNAKKKKRSPKNFKRRMTLFQIKRKKSLGAMQTQLDTQKGLTFRPKINQVSRRLVEHIRPFHERWVGGDSKSGRDHQKEQEPQDDFETERLSGEGHEAAKQAVSEFGRLRQVEAAGQGGCECSLRGRRVKPGLLQPEQRVDEPETRAHQQRANQAELDQKQGVLVHAQNQPQEE